MYERSLTDFDNPFAHPDFLAEVKKIDEWIVERYGQIPDSRHAYEEAVLEYYENVP